MDDTSVTPNKIDRCVLSAVNHPCCKGGLGKTTMAKLLFNRLSPSFTHRAFIELNASDGPTEARKHLVNALEQLGASNIRREAAATVLRTSLQDFVRDRAVFLVLDNVWTADQLDYLLPDQIGAGSRVIVTSRISSMPSSRAWQVSSTCIACAWKEAFRPPHTGLSGRAYSAKAQATAPLKYVAFTARCSPRLFANIGWHPPVVNV